MINLSTSLELPGLYQYITLTHDLTNWLIFCSIAISGVMILYSHEKYRDSQGKNLGFLSFFIFAATLVLSSFIFLTKVEEGFLFT